MTARYSNDGCKLLRNGTVIETYFHPADAAQAAFDLTKHGRAETPQHYAKERAAKQRNMKREPSHGQRWTTYAQRAAFALQRIATLNGEDLAEVSVGAEVVDLRKIRLDASICSSCGTALRRRAA